MGRGSCLGRGVDCYSVASVELGEGALVSMRAFLCTAGHDYNDSQFLLTGRPIVIAPWAWVAAEAFVGPGVTVNEGAVVAATASVFRNVDEWTVVVGNPAVEFKKRNKASFLGK